MPSKHAFRFSHSSFLNSSSRKADVCLRGKVLKIALFFLMPEHFCDGYPGFGLTVWKRSLSTNNELDMKAILSRDKRYHASTRNS